VQCRSYGPEVRGAFGKSFDLLGGIGALVRNKTVTVKLNLTATDFSPFLGRPVGETFMTHEATVLALTSQLFAAGAKRVRIVESTQSKAPLRSTLALADWDVKALEAMGKVELENSRNLGEGRSYAHLKCPPAATCFSLRSQPCLRRNGRDGFPGQVEKPRHRGSDALDEESFRHHAQLALRR